ncbi:DUF1501 domain-containing protein [Verrucomicrobiota bacterium sgz303538]
MNPAEHTPRPEDLFLTRRDFLRRSGMGFGALSLATLLRPELFGANAQAAAAVAGTPLSPKQPHFAAKAKHVIHIFAEGAPSHVDTWDPKPELAKWAGQQLPGLRGKAFPSPFEFTKRGKSGIEVSEVFPKLGEHVDDMAIIRSMYTDIPAHEVAQVFMNTGSLRLPRPSLGSWVTYGLGSENQNMPGFIVLRPGGSKPSMTACCQSAFLPGVFQGTMVNTANTRPDQIIENIRNQFIGLGDQRQQLDFVHKLNELHAAKLQQDAQLEARLEAFEMAFKMQTEATDAFDISKESPATRELYGTTPQGNQLLIARRLVERGVRFVQVWAGGWDMHNDLEGSMEKRAGEIDGPLAALLTDLKQRGLLDQTLVIWGGEFGRTVTYDNNGNERPGRDHNNKAFSTWLAGGGVKGGTVYGATDEFGAKSVENKVHVHDLHATILALLGFDHTKLTYRVNGRDFRLTDVSGNVVRDIIA